MRSFAKQFLLINCKLNRYYPFLHRMQTICLQGIGPIRSSNLKTEVFSTNRYPPNFSTSERKTSFCLLQKRLFYIPLRNVHEEAEKRKRKKIPAPREKGVLTAQKEKNIQVFMNTHCISIPYSHVSSNQELAYNRIIKKS